MRCIRNSKCVDVASFRICRALWRWSGSGRRRRRRRRTCFIWRTPPSPASTPPPAYSRPPRMSRDRAMRARVRWGKGAGGENTKGCALCRRRPRANEPGQGQRVRWRKAAKEWSYTTALIAMRRTRCGEEKPIPLRRASSASHRRLPPCPRRDPAPPFLSTYRGLLRALSPALADYESLGPVADDWPRAASFNAALCLHRCKMGSPDRHKKFTHSYQDGQILCWRSGNGSPCIDLAAGEVERAGDFRRRFALEQSCPEV